MTANRMYISAQKREVVGRKVKHLRAQGLTPAHVYGNNSENVSISVSAKEFNELFSKAGETSLIELAVEGESMVRPVLVTSLGRHPVTGKILHVDFLQVNLKEKTTAAIPVEVVGESEAVKNGGSLVIVYNEIEVEALPTDFPEKFVVDAAKLQAIGNDFTVADLVFDRSKITISLEDDEILATVKAQEEEIEEVVAEEPAEVELTKQGATKEDEEASATEKAEKSD